MRDSQGGGESDPAEGVPMSRRLKVVYQRGAEGVPTSCCPKVSPPQCGGAVPAPLSERWAEMARQLPRGAQPSGRPNRRSLGKVFYKKRNFNLLFLLVFCLFDIYFFLLFLR